MQAHPFRDPYTSAYTTYPSVTLHMYYTLPIYHSLHGPRTTHHPLIPASPLVYQPPTTTHLPDQPLGSNMQKTGPG